MRPNSGLREIFSKVNVRESSSNKVGSHKIKCLTFSSLVSHAFESNGRLYEVNPERFIHESGENARRKSGRILPATWSRLRACGGGSFRGTRQRRLDSGFARFAIHSSAPTFDPGSFESSAAQR